ncbi:V-type proton ATPase subunit S1 [Cryptotermes secundus]|uniref:V-type proton ATPase subunit S1 n=1 Tax=Cryptotermes secundus TaxID=105785 RepID=UPI001454E2C5|nr:V-type proton ATPase subunit S1 [Cryptotermes secundus]
MAGGRMCFDIFFCCLVVIFGGSCGAEFVPVLVWESNKPTDVQISSPALKKYSTDDFADFFINKLSAFGKKPLVVVFTEENLSVEDFSWQDLAENSVFPHLESVIATAANVDFIPSVSNPLKALQRLEKLGYQWQTVRDLETMNVPEHGGVVMVLEMENAKVDEDRPDFLRRHDCLISSVYSRLVSQADDVVAVYTGRYSSWIEPENEPVLHRVRRLLVEPAPNATVMLMNTSSILIYASDKPQVTESDIKKILTLLPDTVKRKESATYQSVRAKFSTNSTDQIILEFFFFNSTSSPGYWSLENVTYYINSPNHTNKMVLTPESGIVAPVMFSYHCSSKTVFKAVNISLTFQNFQAQPYMEKTKAFDDAYNCELFFTPPIWSGLFVTSILAFIMMWGLAMIMDIRTMDQYDDPKGKTITISVSE